jgi:hypothetical protein
MTSKFQFSFVSVDFGTQSHAATDIRLIILAIPDSVYSHRPGGLFVLVLRWRFIHPFLRFFSTNKSLCGAEPAQKA